MHPLRFHIDGDSEFLKRKSICICFFRVDKYTAQYFVHLWHEFSLGI